MLTPLKKRRLEHPKSLNFFELHVKGVKLARGHFFQRGYHVYLPDLAKPGAALHTQLSIEGFGWL